MNVSERIAVRGVVQGVGFRPFVHRLANELGLSGRVGNDSCQVFVEVHGPGSAIDRLVDRLRAEAPPLASIEEVRREPLDPDSRTLDRTVKGAVAGAVNGEAFQIAASVSRAGASTLLPPDVACCEACRREMFDPEDRRHRHPFISCTDCGPRYSIIRGLPYDRPLTSLAHFPMCAACREEYEDPTNRRYHAQPISCHDCGPKLRFESSLPDTGEPPVTAAASALSAGRIVAVKGVGGYHLVCSALDDQAVRRLRERKHRPEKPFAVMVGSLARAAELVELSDAEVQILSSAAAPIVLCRARDDSPLAAQVAPGNPLLGVVLPYTPVHHLLLEEFGGPIVVTSANHHGESIAHRREQIEQLAPLWDALLDHDRPIVAPSDDSVVRVLPESLRPLLPVRRARGYAPVPVAFDGDSSVLAAGCELKNTFCVATRGHAWISPHLGDMQNLQTLEVFETRVGDFLQLYDVEPEVVACDAHPDHLTSRWVATHHHSRARPTQHHHAHIASLMAEHRLDPDRSVLGFAFDGTGYGRDGTIWGGEVLRCTAHGFDRLAHLAAVPLPGGDQAVRHPWRVALAHLWAAEVPWPDDLPLCSAVAPAQREMLRRQLEAGTACVPTTSMGRLFDAVASLVGLRHEITYEAQAAIALEHAASRCTHADRGYSFELEPHSGPGAQRIGCRSLFTAILEDLASGVATCCIAHAFHESVARLVAELSKRHLGAEEVVALSGGVFQNALITERCIARLTDQGHRVLTHHLVPPNDGGLALGQAYIAAHSRHRGHRGHRAEENASCV